MKAKDEIFEGIPGVESEKIPGSAKLGFILSVFTSLLLFGLLPLSQFIRTEEWLVRQVDAPTFTPPLPPKTKMEKAVEKQERLSPKEPVLSKSVSKLDLSPMAVSLEVGPGDFKAAFSLASFNPAPSGFDQELIFEIHDLDRNPSVLKRGTLRYPSNLKRKGLEGEVKLLVQIDEVGKVKVLEVVSSTHPDFVKPSRLAAENSVYEPPRRNGEAVKVQFYLPVRFSLLK